MWLDQVNDISEIFRFSLPYYIAVLVPILFILSPAEAATEFPVYRLQHFDLQGVKYGKKYKYIVYFTQMCYYLNGNIFHLLYIRLKKFNP